MSRPRSTVVKALRKELRPGMKLLVAVSGGVDSVALLYGALELRRELKLKLEVAHVDHNLRSGSAADAAFVAELAQKYELPFHLKRARKPGRSENIENWGRKLRYAFFSEIVLAGKIDWVLTAHNANDVAETFLMRLVARKALKSIEAQDPRRRIMRPLLSVSRTEIESYVTQRNRSYREDPTNADTDFLRNRIRHILLPLLEREFDPRIVEIISHTARSTAQDIELLFELLCAPLARVSGHRFGSKAWLTAARQECLALPEALRWRFTEHLFEPKLGFSLGQERSQTLCRFLLGKAEGMQLPGKVALRRREGGILLLNGDARVENL